MCLHRLVQPFRLLLKKDQKSLSLSGITRTMKDTPCRFTDEVKLVAQPVGLAEVLANALCLIKKDLPTWRKTKSPLPRLYFARAGENCGRRGDGRDE
jgi:hypothetical protein